MTRDGFSASQRNPDAFDGGAISAPRRLGLRPEKCISAARLTMPSRLGCAVRWLMIRVGPGVGRCVSGESPPRRMGTPAMHFSELPRLRQGCGVAVAGSYERGGCQAPSFFVRLRHTFTEAAGTRPSQAEGAWRRPKPLADRKARGDRVAHRTLAASAGGRRFWRSRCSYPCRACRRRSPETAFVKPGSEPHLLAVDSHCQIRPRGRGARTSSLRVLSSRHPPELRRGLQRRPVRQRALLDVAPQRHQ